MTDGPLDPNAIADTYEALSDLHDLVTRLADARKAITGAADSTLDLYASMIADRRATFGNATRVRNPFSMADYRAAHDGQLPTLDTAGLTDTERRALRRLGIITADESFRLPTLSVTGQRLPIFPEPGLNAEYDMLQDFELPEAALTLFHISDTHLGYGHRATSDGNANTKWADRTRSSAAFDAVVHRAIDEDVDAVVHTGDLFDHEVVRTVSHCAVQGLELLAANDVPFYYVLGDHDRMATGNGGGIVDAVARLERLTADGTIVHGSPAGHRLAGTPLTLFGVDATGVSFEQIRGEYSLEGWDIGHVDFDPRTAGETTALCLHDVHESGSLTELIAAVRSQGIPPDLVLCGHAHTPPFDGDDPWQTTVEGVRVSCAGPTIPVSSYFDDHDPAYTRITLEETGGIGLSREPISLALAE